MFDKGAQIFWNTAVGLTLLVIVGAVMVANRMNDRK